MASVVHICVCISCDAFQGMLKKSAQFLLEPHNFRGVQEKNVVNCSS